MLQEKGFPGEIHLIKSIHEQITILRNATAKNVSFANHVLSGHTSYSADKALGN
jgi:hypothetical protein